MQKRIKKRLGLSGMSLLQRPVVRKKDSAAFWVGRAHGEDYGCNLGVALAAVDTSANFFVRIGLITAVQMS
jgi:hypothetical protein